MWRLSLAGITTAILVIAAYALAPAPAYACTPPGPEFDPVASAEVIVEGRILGYDVLPESPEFGLASIVLQMDVERVWKGLTGGSVRIVDNEALVRYPKETTWGPGGLCNAFFEDPSGSYAILGVSRIGDEMYSIRGFSVFYLGDDATGEGYESAVDYLESYPGPRVFPDTGFGPGAPDAGSRVMLTAAAILAAIGATLLGLVILTRVTYLRRT